MTRNVASPRARWRRVNPMQAHDRLPAPLRAWVATAALPWSASSVLRLWYRAMAVHRCPRAALDALSRAEAATLAREAARVWGDGYPAGQAGALANRR